MNLIIPRAFPSIIRFGNEEDDRAFAADFSDQVRESLTKHVVGLFESRGWKLDVNGIGAFSKEEDRMIYEEIYKIDRAAASAYEYLVYFEWLSGIIQSATDSQLKGLRIAFKAGMALAEARAYDMNLGGPGRPPIKELQYGVIGKAVATWKALNPSQEREPTAREVESSVVGVSEKRQMPTGRSFANRYSEWKKIHRNYCSESKTHN